jgi:hypothetical protein
MHKLLVVGFSLSFFIGSAQSITSPYTNFGIGEINDFSLPHQSGMAGVGLALPNLYYINLKNPALLPYTLLTSFQVGLQSDVRTYNGGGPATTDATASISHMVFAVPVKSGKWGSAVSLLPYSSVNYDFLSRDIIANSTDSVANFFEGEGGLSQVSWSNGFKVYKNLNLGFRASYVFGSITRRVNNLIEAADISSPFIINYEEMTSYSDVVLSVSMAHRIKVKEEVWFNYGVVYDLPGNLQGSRSETLARLNQNQVEIVAIELAEDQSIAFDLPSSLSIGTSIERFNKMQVGLDVQFLRWSSEAVQEDNGLHNSYSIALGAQITPDYKDVNSYLKRVDYRFGFGVSQLPYLASGTEINEIGINFGASFPTKSFSSLDMGFKLGTRGTITNNLIRENFAQVVFGLTINDRWFIKRRYD